MTAQQQAAMQSMIEWLADEHELGRKPSKIEIAGEFDLHNMHYYIFKYKKIMLGKWLLGVCGGYETPSDTEHCGHVFSEMQPYDPATAEQEAIAIVEMIREYWMKQAAALEAEQAPNDAADPKKESSGIFNGFVLLNSSECDLDQIKANLLQDWNISCSPTEGEGQNSAEEKEGILVFEVEGFTLAVSFVDAPIPDGEAEHYAQGNYLWQEAAEITKTHVAQIILAVFTRSASPLDSGRLYTKLAASCLKLPNAIGLYSSGTVFQPELFVELAEMMKSDDECPLLNLVHFGLVRTEAGTNGYTVGLEHFGKHEFEVLDSQSTPAELRNFLIDISAYVVEQDVTLRDGETIGFTAEQKLPITRSEGVYVNGDSLKVEF
ncbi:DUF4261 domain-containing protein [Paenibacillus apiarius]|uniref:DUF4261 domain-containing protein n=1 Tax=Paenibacillus apiarius TaxID=46240 RepID=A0ABT4E102_9BACL|nr:DUF4261 domain-containing protein [Paenibacillus apiarius]MCY9517005.1 DUF4261 domain-containing protein [Paenibacillus apiarius]MCY9523287.1 DUF4261 domain-containing protein [Paenibacillus apiarius]MCY9554215.1 DUF4261 domain-containing protein [Paenibacillus apiarius]MCY9560826.1 DUF4261 domain-containing protein [Paenibacillus apiarius]MCY9682748.1 DUF4261 domain-containing protein [Paenibacillus apiarius]